MSGELRGYGDYYRSQKTMAKPHSLYVKDVIENGIKEKL
jgi:predicted DNA-binding protein